MRYCREVGILCALFAVLGLSESLSIGDFFGFGPQESAYYGHHHGPPPPHRPYRGHPAKVVTYSKPSYGPKPTVVRYLSKRPSSLSLSPYSVVSESLSGGGWGGPPPPGDGWGGPPSSGGGWGGPPSSRGKPSSRPRGRPASRPAVMSVQEDEEIMNQSPDDDTSGMMDIMDVDLTNTNSGPDTQGPETEFIMNMDDINSQSAPIDEDMTSQGPSDDGSSAPVEEPMIMMMQSPRRPSTSGTRASAGKKPSSRGRKPSSKPPVTYYEEEADDDFSPGFPPHYTDVYSYDGGEGWGWGPSSPPSGGSSSGGSRPPTGSAGGSGSGGPTDTSDGGPEGTGVNEEEEATGRAPPTSRPAAQRRPQSATQGRQTSRPASRPQAQRPASASAASRPSGGSSPSSASQRPSTVRAQQQDARSPAPAAAAAPAGRSAGSARTLPAQQQQTTGGQTSGAAGAGASANSNTNRPSTSQFRSNDSPSEASQGAYGVPGNQAGQPLGGDAPQSNSGLGNLRVQPSISSDQQELSNLSGLDADLLRIVQQIISETKV